MNWKRNSWTLLVAGLFVAGFTNCSDWTETENEWVLESQNTETNKPESYYQNLRAWKASDDDAKRAVVQLVEQRQRAAGLQAA